MPAFRLLKVGGYSGLTFSIVWIVCSTGYLAVVGIPPEPPGLLETVELLRQPSYQLLFWLWPIAYLAAIPFSLGAREYLHSFSPVAARLGSAFLLLYAGLWFVFHAVVMAGISVARADPVDETQLSLIFTLTRTLGSPLFWAIALFEAIWATSLLRQRGLPRVAGWFFVLGAASSVLYFVLRYTGPFRPAEIMHEVLIFFMILGVGSLSITLLREAPERLVSSNSGG
jgi:hypothetical protein